MWITVGIMLLGASPSSAFRVYVDAGWRTSKLQEQILEEAKDTIFTSSASSELSVFLREDDARLTITTAPGGVRLIDRHLDTQDDEQTIRIAALLARRAMRLSGQLDPPDDDPFEAVLALGWSSELWAQPRSPSLGPSLALWLRFGSVYAGTEIGWLGRVCCRRRGDGISADTTEWRWLGTLGLDWFRGKRLRFGTDFGAGVTFLSVDARSLAFADRAPIESLRSVEGLLRGALRAELHLGARFALRLSMGAMMRIAPTEIRLPDGYPNEAIRPGRVVPSVQLQISTPVW